MPKTERAMNRLYDAPGVMFNTKDEDVTGEVSEQTIRVTLDMERVLFVREDPDDPERCVVEMTGECVTLLQTRDVFAANWQSYRDHVARRPWIGN